MGFVGTEHVIENDTHTHSFDGLWEQSTPPKTKNG